MKNHLLHWFLSLLLCVSLLACNFPGIQLIFDHIFPNPPKAPVQVESVTVLPATGSGHFTATVKYSYTDGDGILCIVDTGQHDDETVLSHGLQGSSASISEPFSFDFVKPGEHTLTCKGYSGNSSASDTFTVTSGPDSGSSGSQPLTIKSTSAGLTLLVEKATSSIPGLFPHHCVPEVNIAADGTLTGSCSVTMYGNSEQDTGTLIGNWYADTGKINFHLETKSVYTTSRITGGTQETGRTITNTIIDGTGNLVSALQATGNADWSTDCSSSNADLIHCFRPGQASEKANGTVPWQLNFNP